jgi:fructosamine-3-kinase
MKIFIFCTFIMTTRHSIRSVLESFLNEKISVFPGSSGKLITASGKKYFLKSGKHSETYMCEMHGLMELRKAGTIQIANPIIYGDTFILTEFIEAGGIPAGFFENFGRNFARMHRYTGENYGFFEDNFIGATVQINQADKDEMQDWVAFYFNKRLLFQYQLAEKNHFVSKDFRRNFIKLEKNITAILADSEEEPCLLHGDLWSGNFICNRQGEAVLIDPAVYYGHREADLAMTKLFGGFSDAFYKAYQQEYPLKPGWEYREDIYKLYHVMNHLNIFGRGYLGETERILEKYA